MIHVPIAVIALILALTICIIVNPGPEGNKGI